MTGAGILTPFLEEVIRPKAARSSQDSTLLSPFEAATGIGEFLDSVVFPLAPGLVAFTDAEPVAGTAPGARQLYTVDAQQRGFKSFRAYVSLPAGLSPTSHCVYLLTKGVELIADQRTVATSGRWLIRAEHIRLLSAEEATDWDLLVRQPHPPADAGAARELVIRGLGVRSSEALAVFEELAWEFRHAQDSGDLVRALQVYSLMRKVYAERLSPAEKESAAQLMRDVQSVVSGELVDEAAVDGSATAERDEKVADAQADEALGLFTYLLQRFSEAEDAGVVGQADRTLNAMGLVYARLLSPKDREALTPLMRELKQGVNESRPNMPAEGRARLDP